MSRVKRGVTSHAKHKKVYKAAKGFYGRRKNTIRAAKAAVEKAGAICLPRPQAQEAHLPRALDPAHQCRGASVRHDLQRLHQRPVQVGHHGGPQGAVGSRHHTSRRRSRRSPRRPRPRWRRKPSPHRLSARFLKSSWPGLSRPSTRLPFSRTLSDVDALERRRSATSPGMTG